MDILLNEQPLTIPAGSTLFALRDRHQPQADVVILNGFPAGADVPLAGGDRVVLIRRGAIPGAEELEALLTARHTPGVHERIKRATVGIAGAGGLGSAVAVALARLGIGSLVIADFDLIEPSNLNRQQFFIDQLGLPKVAALAANLKRINPYVAVQAHQLRLDAANLPALFRQVDVMVEAFDAADQKALLTETFRAACPDRPLVAASGLAGCGPANRIRTRRAGHNFFLVGDEVSAARPGQGLMAPRVGVAAHHQANCVLCLLLGEDPIGDAT